MALYRADPLLFRHICRDIHLFCTFSYRNFQLILISAGQYVPFQWELRGPAYEASARLDMRGRSSRRGRVIRLLRGQTDMGEQVFQDRTRLMRGGALQRAFAEM